MTTLQEPASADQRARLQERIARARRPGPGAEERIRRVPDDEGAQLSFAERRLWFLDQYGAQDPTYNIPVGFWLDGALDVEALEAAFRELVAAHDALHTCYPADGGEPVPRLIPGVQPGLRIVEVADEHEAAERLGADVRRRFDLSAELPLRAALYRVEPEQHLFLLEVHHIAADGWSLSIILDELAARYRSRRQGDGAAPVPPPSIRYRDFAAWQRQRVAADGLESELAWWRRCLSGAPEVVELPADRPRPAVASNGGARHVFDIDPSLAELVRTKGRRDGVTPFMLALAAVTAILHRVIGAPDVVIGAPIAGRPRPELERVVGCFVNTLALRVQVDDDATVGDLLRTVRDVTLEAYEHQEVPFEKLVEDLRPQRDLSITPIFQFLLNVHNMPPLRLDLEGLHASWADIDTGTTKFDLSLAIVDGDGTMSATLTYNTDLFEQATAERLGELFSRALEGMCCPPETRIAQLELVSPGERRRLLEDGNPSAVPAPTRRAVHQLIEEQARRVPSAVAVTCEGVDLTYAELDRRANQLAHRLRAMGAGPEVRVGLHLERSVGLIVGMLGILKSGAAYVPIDTRYPPDRVRAALRDADVALLVSEPALSDALGPLGIPTVALGESELEGEPETVPSLEVGPRNLMYVLFTSGSTGRPKAVGVEHGNYVAYLDGLMDRLGLEPGWSYAVVSTLSADLGTTNIYGALTTGGRVHVMTYDRATDPAAMAEYMARHHIDVMKLVPSHFAVLLGADDPRSVVPHRRLVLAGEACPPELVARALELRPAAVAQNHYGPTETTVSMLGCDAAENTQRGVVALGSPFRGTRAYVLDARMQLVPPGLPGELYVGGTGVSRGYLGHAAATADRFLPDPYGPDPGARLYRTGDRVRHRADGTIEFLGRVDDQVKIRGFRVEPGEVEAALASHPLVERAAVRAWRDDDGDPRLVGYVTLTAADGDGNSTAADGVPAELRDALRRHLPDHMVPAVILTLPSLPLSANGKLDREALPRPDRWAGGARAYEAPATPVQLQVAEAWQRVLGLERVGLDDDLFGVGGDSFKAVRIAGALPYRVPIVEMFKHPTVRELAAYIESLASGTAAAEGILHRLTPRGDTATVSLVCIPYGGGSAVNYRPLADALPAEVALWALELPGHDPSRADEPVEPIDRVATRCVEEILARVQTAVVIYGHCLGGALAVEVARRLEAAGRPVHGVILAGTLPSARLPGRFFSWVNRHLPGDRWVSSRAYHDFLKAMGGFDDVMTADDREFLIRALRHDLREAEEYYARAFDEDLPSLKAPIMCVVGEKDRATELFQERHREWGHFSDRVSLAVVARAGHYFLKHQADELAALIHRQVSDWAGATDLPGLPASVTVHPPATRAALAPAGVEPSLRGFGILTAGQFVSLLGTAMSTFGLGVWVYQQTGQIGAFGLILVMATLPALLAWPVAGAVADRVNRRLVMIVADSTAAAAMLVLAWLLWSGGLELWHVYVVTAVGAVANAFQRPAYLAAIAQLVPKRYLGHANGVAQAGTGAGEFIAPLLGGSLIALVGLHGIVVLDVASFLVGLVALLAVRIPDLAFRKLEEPLLREIVTGWRFIVRRQSLVAMVLFFVVFNYLFTLPQVLITPLILTTDGPVVLGLVAAAAGLGMLTGNVLMAVWGGTRRRADGMVGFTLLTGVATVVAGTGGSAWLAAVGMFGLFCSLVLINAHWLTIIQSKVGLELQGRVLSTNQMMALSMMPLGFLSAAPLVAGATAVTGGEVSAMRFVLVLTGVVLLVWGILGLRYRRLRYMEDILPDAIPGAVIGSREALAEEADRLLERPGATRPSRA